MAGQRLRGGLGVLCLVVISPSLPAGPPARGPLPPGDAAALSARIDEHLAAGYAVRKVTPAAPADDAEFLRRVYLDLAGRIPRVSEARIFLADKAPEKRRALVRKLLDSPQYVNHFAHVWRALLLPPSNTQQVQAFAPQVEQWLRSRLRDNVRYDRMVRELLTANVIFRPPVNGQPFPYDPGAAAFYQANELKPENLAASTSRIFLGVKIECAQCHNHPFGSWTRKQFWEYTAFFSGIQPGRVAGGRFTPPQDLTASRTIKIPGTDKVVKARYLDGAEPNWKSGVSTRATLADWMTRADNPYFARAAVNRLWAHFFGLGLVDPVDDLGTDNAPSHPELLDDLARAFAASGYDQKYLIRAITGSRAYQLSSAARPGTDDPRAFARMPLKGLTAEQIFDSLVVATGYRESGVPAGRLFIPFGTRRAEFLAKFANPSDRRTEQHTSILQALALMNGTFVADAISLDRSQTLAAILDSPFLDNRQRLETLYLAALSRPMRPREVSRLLPYVERGGPSGDPRKALGDVFWALLNSSEFILNH